MYRSIFITIICFLLIQDASFAQHKKKSKKNKDDEALNIDNIRTGYKKMFMDSLALTPALADTAAAIEADNIQKMSGIARDKKLEKDEKDFQTGMLAEQKDNKLKLILPRETFDKYTLMQKRWQAEREAQQKAAKDAQNNQPINPNYNRGYGYGGGYGGYGGGYGRY